MKINNRSQVVKIRSNYESKAGLLKIHFAEKKIIQDAHKI